MRNLFTRGGLRFTRNLALAACMFFAAGLSKTYGAGGTGCGVTLQGSLGAPACGSWSSASGGQGAYWNLTVTNGEYYQFYYTNPGSTTTAASYFGTEACSAAVPDFCVNGVTYTNSSSSSPAIIQAATTSWPIGFYSSNANEWCASSSVLYYMPVVAPAPTWSVKPTPVCLNTATTYTITAGSYQNYWNWSVTGGTVNSGQGTTSASITFTTGGTQTITVTPYNGGSGGCAGTALTGSITVDAAVGGTITGATNPVCNGASPGTLTVTPSGGSGSGYTYQWYNSSGVISGATAATYLTPTLTANMGYYCAVTNSGCSQTGNTSTTSITVDPVVSAAISGGTTPICNGVSPGTLTATASGGSGSGYTYQWYNSSGIISGATANTYATPTLTASNAYHCSVTNTTCSQSATTSTTSITVDAAVGASITPSFSYCYGSTPGALTASASGGTGSGYTYLWYKNGTSTGVTTSTYQPGATTVTTTYTATSTWTVPTGVTSVTAYLWGGGGGGGGTSQTGAQAAWANGGGGGGGACSINTQAVSGGQAWTITIGAGGAGGTSTSINGVAGTATTMVNGSTTLSAAGGAGGTGDGSGSGTFAGGAGGSTGTGTVISGGKGSTGYDASPGYTGTGGGGAGSTGAGTTAADGCNTAAGGTGTYPGGAGGYNTECSVEGNLAGVSGTAPGGGGSGDCNWTAQENGGAGAAGQAVLSYTVPAAGTYYCVVTNSCAPATSSNCVITQDAALTASQSGGASPICYGGDPGVFTASGSGGTGSYTYVWYVNGTATSTTTNTYDPGALTATSTINCQVTSGSCGTVTTTGAVITVYSNLTASQSGGTSPICYGADPGVLTASGSGGTGSYTYLWYKNGSSTGIATSTYDPGTLTTTSTIYCAVTSGSCGTVSATATVITVYGNLSATQSGGTSPICYNTAPGTFTANASNGTGSYTYLWYLNGLSTGITTSTYTPGNFTSTSTVYCSVTSGSCGTVSTSGTTIKSYSQPKRGHFTYLL